MLFVLTLGYILMPDGLTMDPTKVETIMSWPTPYKVKDFQSFLRFANFCHHFIWNYSDIHILLTCLMCKGTDWKWSPACQEAFDHLKMVFTSPPILMSWLPDMLFIVETNASDYMLTAILLTHLPNSEIHSIAFHSCMFSGPELNYNVHDNEFMTKSFS